MCVGVCGGSNVQCLPLIHTEMVTRLNSFLGFFVFISTHLFTLCSFGLVYSRIHAFSQWMVIFAGLYCLLVCACVRVANTKKYLSTKCDD